jgi:protoporphyrinogen/coproporphyrinogen III oxidase
MDGPRHEIVVLGAGLAGMTAAYELRERNPIVLEARERVGGRTLSGQHDSYWYNCGAQYVWDDRTLQLCDRLGLPVVGANGARTAVFLRDRLVVASNPYLLLAKLPISTAEKVNFAFTVTRLRRLAARTEGVDADLDARPLADVFGRVSPTTREVLEMVTESGTGVSPEEVSGAIGLGYAIHLFGGDVNHTLKAVHGGTQRITEAIAERLGPERVLLNARVESVEDRGDRVEIRYRRDGSAHQIDAEACIVALPADAVLDAVAGLSDRKRVALEQMLPYAPIVSVAWLTGEDGGAPWDRLLVVPAVGLSFELFSNNAYFVRRLEQDGRRPGGAFVTLSTGPRADALWELDDEAIRDRVAGDLARMFPSAQPVFARAHARVYRWRALPRFRRGSLRHQQALREPSGRIWFCGDYTSQPGTPGAVNSGFHTALAVRGALG